MKGLDDYITGKYDPNAPFNQVDISDVWEFVINELPVSDEDIDRFLDCEHVENDFEHAYKVVTDSHFVEIQKMYAKEIAKQFLSIRKMRDFKNELDNE